MYGNVWRKKSGITLNVVQASADEIGYLHHHSGLMVELKIIKKDDICIWSPNDEYDTWHGSCGAELVFDESSPYENEFKFCPSCGRALTQFVPDKSKRIEVEL